MVHREVGHYVVHAVVSLLADLLGVLVDPLAGHLLPDWGLPHVPVVGGHVAVAHVAVVVAPGSRHLVQPEGVVEAGVHGVVGGLHVSPEEEVPGSVAPHAGHVRLHAGDVAGLRIS